MSLTGRVYAKAREPSCGVQPWPGDFPQGMEEDIVYGSPYCVSDALLFVSGKKERSTLLWALPGSAGQLE